MSAPAEENRPTKYYWSWSSPFGDWAGISGGAWWASVVSGLALFVAIILSNTSTAIPTATFLYTVYAAVLAYLLWRNRKKEKPKKFGNVIFHTVFAFWVALIELGFIIQVMFFPAALM